MVLRNVPEAKECIRRRGQRTMKMVMSGRLQCRVRARAKLMQYFLSIPEYRMALMERIGKLGIGEKKVSEKMRGCFPAGIGMAVDKMQVLDEEALELAYDKIVRGEVLEAWMEHQSLAIAYHSRKALEIDHQTISVPVRNYMIYALVRNERCLEEIHKIIHEPRKESPGKTKLKESDQAFLAWFPEWQREDARWCMELFEEIGRKTEDADAQEENEVCQTFWMIARSGYRKMWRSLGKCDRVNGTVFAGLSSEQDMALRLSVSVLGLAMAEEIGIPRDEDFLFYTFLPVLQDYQVQMEESEETVEVSEQGRKKFREMKERYHCEDYVKSCLEHPLRDVSDEILRRMMQNEGEAETGMEMETGETGTDYREIFSIFHMNPRMLQGIQLTDQEIQKIFSLNSDMEWEEYMPWLLSATLCKYIGKLTKHCERDREEQREKKEAGNHEIDLEECGKLLKRLQEIQKENEELKRQLEQIKTERKNLDQSLCQANQCLEQKKDQIEELRREQERRGEELDKLRRCVQEMAEGFGLPSHNSYPAVNDRQSAQSQSAALTPAAGSPDSGKCAENLRTILKGRRVIVIGGHVNWQKRFREQFPQWQFVAADKNNYDGESIRSKEVIIVNTAVLKHSCYYRVLAERGENQILLYVNGSNPERCMQELMEQLECD